MFGVIIHNGKDALAFLILFGFSIFVHELGHFIAALRCGMVVDTFSIGFGPAVWKRKIRGVTCKIGWIPFGGYVALPQLDPSGMAAIQGTDDSRLRPEATAGQAGQKSEVRDQGSEGKGQKAEKKGEQAEPARILPPIAPWKKIVVSLSGCVGNILFAIVLAWIIYLSPDATTKEISTQIGFVSTNSVAFQKGMRAGDQIVAVNGKKVVSWFDYNIECTLGGSAATQVDVTFLGVNGERTASLPLEESPMGSRAIEGLDRSHLCVIVEVLSNSVAEKAGFLPDDVVKEFNGIKISGSQQFVDLTDSNGGRSVELVVERRGKPVVLHVTPEFNAEHGKSMIGVQIAAKDPYFTVWMMYKRPWDQLSSDASGIVRILKALVTPRESRQAARGLGGPLFILIALWAAIKISFLNALGFVRFLNVNLAILNLLPIPVLDGGHMVFSLWEAITRRRVHPRVVNVLVNAFAALLIGLMLLITYRDVLRFRVLKGWGQKQADAEIAAQSTNAAVSATNSQPEKSEKPGE